MDKKTVARLSVQGLRTMSWYEFRRFTKWLDEIKSINRKEWTNETAFFSLPSVTSKRKK